MIKNIVYNAEPHDTSATNAFLSVQVDYAYHNSAWPVLGDAVVSTLSSLSHKPVYEFMTSTER
jgi:hypothetical protein